MRHFLILIALLGSGLALGEEKAPRTDLAPAPEPPQIPEAVQSGEPLEPEVTIIERKQETLQEYRINGRLYMVKITPGKGEPYYMIDTDGDGTLDTRRTDIKYESSVPQWVLFSWN